MEKKKMSLIIGCVALVLVAAIVVLVILLSGGSSAYSPSKAGDVIKSGKNYTLEITGDTAITIKRENDKYYYKKTGSDIATEEWYLEITGGKNYQYIKAVAGDVDWTKNEIDNTAKDNLLKLVEQYTAMEKLFDNKSYTKDKDTYTYTGTDKKYGTYTFTALTVVGDKDTATFTMTGTPNLTIKLSEVKKTVVDISKLSIKAA